MFTGADRQKISDAHAVVEAVSRKSLLDNWAGYLKNLCNAVHSAKTGDKPGSSQSGRRKKWIVIATIVVFTALDCLTFAGAVALAGTAGNGGIDWSMSGVQKQLSGGMERLKNVFFVSPAPIQEPLGLGSSGSRISALGHLEPRGEVIHLALPGFLADERVDKVLLGDGDPVEQGQVVCSMDNGRRLATQLAVTGRQLQVAVARLEKVRAGAKQGAIDSQRHQVANLRAERTDRLAAQQAVIDRLESRFEFAASDHERYRNLHNDGAISASLLESKKAERDAARGRLLEAKAELRRIDQTLSARTESARARLQQLKEVRPVDLAIAEQEVSLARARMRRIETDLDLSRVRSPISGRVLKIHVRPGEKVTSNGIAELGKADDMIAVAEVYQSDIQDVRLGQSALVTGDGFSGVAIGTVYDIGWRVVGQRIGTDSPSEAHDRRVVEVKIEFDGATAKKLRSLTNMEVEVTINKQPRAIERVSKPR